MPMPDAGELSRMLAGQVQQLAAELLPHGKRDGQEWRVGSLAGEAGSSLAVRLAGQRAGVWCDFASGDRGDALDLVAAVLYRGDRRQAMEWARRFLGLAADAPAPARRPPPPARAEPDPDAERRASKAAGIFAGAHQALGGTPVELYLRRRGIDLAELGRQPRALRYHDSLFNAEGGRSWPAMVAAISGPDGAIQGVHRTWLARDGGGWIKAPLDSPKMSLGCVLGGSIRLWRGASGKPLRDAPAGEAVAIGEGIETCLSVACACPELRVLAAVSLANMAAVILPPVIGTVILLQDNDGGNETARRGFQRAVDAHLARGRRVRVAAPNTPGADWNDVLLDLAE